MMKVGGASAVAVVAGTASTVVDDPGGAEVPAAGAGVSLGSPELLGAEGVEVGSVGSVGVPNDEAAGGVEVPPVAGVPPLVVPEELPDEVLVLPPDELPEDGKSCARAVIKGAPVAQTAKTRAIQGRWRRIF